MKTPLRVLRLLLVEDSEEDALLLVRALQRNGYEVIFERVDTPEAMTAALSNGNNNNNNNNNNDGDRTWDLVISDYSMPRFNGLEALRLLKANRSNLPFILYTGTGNEELAVAAMKEGADDYFIKDIELNYLKVLSVNVESTIKHKKASEQLKMLSHAMMSISDSVYITDVADKIIFVNKAFCQTYGYNEENEKEVLGRHISLIWKEEKEEKIVDERLKNISYQNLKFDWSGEISSRRKDGREIPISLSRSIVRDENGREVFVVGVIRDITERKQAELVRETLIQKLQEKHRLLQVEQKKYERLLLNVLPKPIVERLKIDQSAIADGFIDVTVLFADIVNFTSLTEPMSPEALVKLLNEIFSGFDRLAEKHHLEKIKTIGDAYMVVGGLPIPRSDHAEAVAEMALDMQKVISRYETPDGEPLSLRIGINSGPVVAGIIGLKKFSYDLWGDTVNIAYRMEEHGITGCIQVTESTYERLRDKYIFEKRGVIQVKNKGDMVTYLLKGNGNSSETTETTETTEPSEPSDM